MQQRQVNRVEDGPTRPRLGAVARYRSAKAAACHVERCERRITLACSLSRVTVGQYHKRTCPHFA
jgi:hypothetical protein